MSRRPNRKDARYIHHSPVRGPIFNRALYDEDMEEWRKRNRGSSSEGGWTERMSGTIDDHDVTVKFGTGVNDGHTLIDDASNNASNRDFDRRREHNHYGPRREDNGHLSEDRGYYTGPGH